MPLYYDVTKSCTTNATAPTETTHLWGNTVANQETGTIIAVYPHSYNFGTAGSAGVRVKTNTGTAATGGNTTGLNGTHGVAKNTRWPAAQMTWLGDGAAITPGGTLAIRESIGFSQTGGQGGWVAMTPQQGIQMLPGAPGSPVDIEFTSVGFSNSVPFDLIVEFTEGV